MGFLPQFCAPLLQKFADWALSKNAGGTYDGEGDERWAYTISTDSSKTGKAEPYLTRVLLSRWIKLGGRSLREILPFGVYLHKFHKDDGGQPPHSHPWKRAASVVLTGAYGEERVEEVIGVTALLSEKVVRYFNYLTKDDYHRVTKLHGEVWTLFFVGERIPGDPWGFLVKGKHVPWKQYLGIEKAQEKSRIGIPPRVHADDWTGQVLQKAEKDLDERGFGANPELKQFILNLEREFLTRMHIPAEILYGTSKETI